MNKPIDKGNEYYLRTGGVVAIKNRKHARFNFGQTVRIKKISGNIVTVTPDNDDDPEGWAIVDAKDLHNNEMRC